jgi:hypothetical protein
MEGGGRKKVFALNLKRADFAITAISALIVASPEQAGHDGWKRSALRARFQPIGLTGRRVSSHELEPT